MAEMRRNERGRACDAQEVTSTHLRNAVTSVLLAPMLAAGAAHAQTSRAVATSDLEEVTVTTTRIVRRDFVAPTPETTISAADLEARGTTSIGNFLQSLPTVNSVNGTASTGAASSGITSVDLRGLGSNRTLVLVNGRRMVPSTEQGVVDLATVPSVAIGQVQVVTGGSSAAWGSDAVAGVVNLIYDSSFEGVRVSAQYGETAEGDGRETQVAAGFGGEFADGRGHAVVAAEWYEIADRVGQADRDWGRPSWGVIANRADTGPTDGRPRLLISPDIRLSGATFGGVITSPGSLSNIAFGPGGTLIPFAPGANTAPPITIGGTNTIALNNTSISIPTNRRSAIAMIEYALSDDVSMFFDGLISQSEVENPIVPTFNFGNITIRNDNPFIPPALATQLAANNITQFSMGRFHNEFGLYTANNRRTVFSTALGLKGTIADQYKWDLFYQIGESTTDTYQTGNFWLPNFELAVDAVRNPAGNIVCRSALNPTALPPSLRPLATGCVPLNLFGEGAPSAAAINYVSAQSFLNRQQQQDVAGANISGDPFEIWAGPVSLATGIEYRREKIEQQTDPASLARLLTLSNALPVNGQYDVTDIYLEGVIPLLKEVPFAEKLELNAGVRWSDYSTVGNVTTWKAGLVWTPLDSVMVRVSQSRDIRAPNASELFAPGTRTQFTPRDPCAASTQATNPTVAANCAAQGIPPTFVPGTSSVEAVQVGNLNLEVEEGTTTTAGIVYTPSFVSGLEMSADWYRIELEEAIGLLQPQTLVDACYSAGVATACNTVSRDPTTKVITGVRREFINVGRIKMEGTDFAVRYATDLSAGPSWIGDSLTFGLLGTYLWNRSETVNGFQTFQLAGQVDPTAQAIGTGVPKLRMNLTVDWQEGALGVRPRLRYLGSAKFNNAYGPEDININSVDSVLYVDLTIDYRLDVFGTESTIFIGASNLTDEDPPIAPTAQFFPQASNFRLYDLLGRSWFAGARVSF